MIWPALYKLFRVERPPATRGRYRRFGQTGSDLSKPGSGHRFSRTAKTTVSYFFFFPHENPILTDATLCLCQVRQNAEYRSNKSATPSVCHPG